MSAQKTFEVIVEKVYEIEADSLEEANGIANDGNLLIGYCVQSDVVSVQEIRP